MDITALDDGTLIRLIVQADAHALSVLYDRYARLVFGLALHSVGDRTTAEEITQDVFLRVWQRAGTYRSEVGKVSTWLASIARHRAIDQLRRQGVRPEQQAVTWSDLGPEAQPYLAGPHEETELNLRRGRVRAALADLPAEQRDVLALAYFQGLTHSQIAERLDQPLGTVKTRVRLAMQKMRSSLQAEQGDGQ